MDFSNKRVFLDTSPLIYFIEQNLQFSKKLLPIFELNKKGELDFYTSQITIIEVLTLPFKLNKIDLVEKYQSILLASKNFILTEFNFQVSKLTAQLRAKYNLKTPDAIQVASAILNECDFFITNDIKLTQIEEVKVITLEDL